MINSSDNNFIIDDSDGRISEEVGSSFWMIFLYILVFIFSYVVNRLLKSVRVVEFFI